MIKYFIALFIISTSANVFGAPSQDVVDKHVGLALSLPEKEILNGKGKRSCSFSFIHDKSWVGIGNSQQEAATRLQLFCIKKQCEQLVDQVRKSLEDILDLPEQDYRDLLEFSGKTPEQIEAIILERKLGLSKEKTILGCNKSASLRMTAFDFCYSVPVECN